MRCLWCQEISGRSVMTPRGASHPWEGGCLPTAAALTHSKLSDSLQKVMTDAREQPKPPKTLSPEGKRLWSELVEEYRISDRGGLAILQVGLEAHDRMRGAANADQDGRFPRRGTAGARSRRTRYCRSSGTHARSFLPP